MKKIFMGAGFVLLTCAVFAQQSITGKIFDSETNEPLVGVTVLLRNTMAGTTTDNNGIFNITDTSLADSVEVRYVGYTSQIIALKNNHSLSVALQPSVIAMQEVVVTGNRDAQIRSDVPMAINKLSATTISDAKPTLITELINKVPGVAMVNLNNEQHMMSIRQPMGTNAYYLYMEDGIPLRPMGVFNHNALIEMNVFSVSSIEVVKGPASSLYGPEAVGGAVNFISQRPTAMPTVRLGIQGDNYGYKRVQYSAGGKSGKKFGFFLGGFYAKQTNGWMTYSDYDKNSINARFDYQLTSRTQVTLATAYNDYYSETPGSVDSIAFYNRAYTSTSDFTYRKVRSLRTRLSLDHQWSENNSTLLHFIYRDNSIGQNPAYSIKWKSGQTTATGEINDNSFTSKGLILQHTAEIKPIRTKLVGGVSLDYSPVTYNAYQVDLNASLRADGKSVEQYILKQERADIKLANYNANLVNAAAYAQVEIKPMEKMTITVGGRFDDMSFKYTNYLDTTSGKKSYQQFTPKVGVTYQIKPFLGAYANYSQGFSPPSLTSVFRKKANTDPAEFYYNLKAAQFTNYEVGSWITLFQNTLDLDVALYHMTGKNELLNIRQPDNSTDYQSAGKTLHKGIEYGATYRPTSQWMIRFGGTNAIHRFEEFVLSTKPSDEVKDVNGKIMPSSPSWIANSEVIYKPQYIKGLRLGAEWQHMSWWYQDQINKVKYDDRGALGIRGISVLNIRVGYQWKGVEVFANIMNATDELYAFNVTRGNSATSSATYTPAPPRTVVFGVQYNFTSKK